MTATRTILSPQAVLDICPGLTYRQLDVWCRRGLLGPHLVGTGSGRPRPFTRDDVTAIRAMAVVADAVRVTGDARILELAGIYQSAGEQARTGVTHIEVALTDHVRLVVDLPEECP